MVKKRKMSKVGYADEDWVLRWGIDTSEVDEEVKTPYIMKKKSAYMNNYYPKIRKVRITIEEI